MTTLNGKVWADPRETKRKRFKAWLTVENGFLRTVICKRFPTRKAATDWLKARRVENVYQF